VEAYLPDAKEHAQLPRQWIINIVFTVGGDDFGLWAQQQQDNRNNKMAADNNLLIDIDPEIKRVLDQSKFISSNYPYLVVLHLGFNFLHCVASHGTGYHLLKVGSKRRRTQAEVKDDKFEEDMRDEHLNDAINKARRLEHELMASQEKARQNENASTWIDFLIAKGQARVN